MPPILKDPRLLLLIAVVLAVAAIAGGTAGAYFGSRKFDHTVIKRLLAVVLLIAGTKLILTK